eukprot:2950526-Prymnesium_polylepis.1
MVGRVLQPAAKRERPVQPILRPVGSGDGLHRVLEPHVVRRNMRCAATTPLPAPLRQEALGLPGGAIESLSAGEGGQCPDSIFCTRCGRKLHSDRATCRLK